MLSLQLAIQQQNTDLTTLAQILVTLGTFCSHLYGNKAEGFF